MSPLRLWHLMVLTVYVAVGLAVFRFGDYLYRLGDTESVFMLILFAPWIFVGVSAGVLPPFPSRDWIVWFFFSISALPWCLLICLMPFLALQRKEPASPVGVGLLYPLFLMPFLGLMVLVRDHLSLVGCPGCGRRRLVRSILKRPHGRPMKFYYRCAVCDAQHLLPVPGATCPNCGRPTMMPRPYVFWWCSSCKSRYKRLWRRGWEDASGPEDDRFYWLWDPLQALRRLRTLGHQDHDS